MPASRLSLPDAVHRGLVALQWLRRRTRSSELWLIAVATGVGLGAGALAALQGAAAHGLQALAYALPETLHLSALNNIEGWRLFALPLGGLVLGLVTWWWGRWRRQMVDPVEANALHGGRMSTRDSAMICLQTVISNGCGASVGLEAAYAQAGGALGSWIGARLRLRRADLRILVGAGAGAAIGAAFGAPLTGAFYAFEIVLGAYTAANVAPVMAACIAAILVAAGLGATPYLIHADVIAVHSWHDYGLYALLGVLCGGLGILVMRTVTQTERLVLTLPWPRVLRPMLGGFLLMALALVTPQTLSAGHGALHLNLDAHLGLSAILVLAVLKILASITALSFGFRGGLFFASLFVGSLVGQAYAAIVPFFPGSPILDPEGAALVGMAALGVAIVGGPFTMTFLVLEATADFRLTAATLVATLIASALVRQWFGYSFSTWRLHLRGETIRSANDVGWIRTLTAGRMMRKALKVVPESTPLAQVRRMVPLGSTNRIVLVDEDGRYKGIVPTAAVYAEANEDAATVGALAVNVEAALRPDMPIKAIMVAFDNTESDELAVVDQDQKVIGLVSEAYATRRYAEELEKARRDLVGEP